MKLWLSEKGQIKSRQFVTWKELALLVLFVVGLAAIIATSNHHVIKISVEPGPCVVHADCIYRDQWGEIVAWDIRGPVVMDAIPYDNAEAAAEWLTVIAPPLPHLTVRSAAYEWKSK